MNTKELHKSINFPNGVYLIVLYQFQSGISACKEWKIALMYTYILRGLVAVS